jgi:hypothetical protein
MNYICHNKQQKWLNPFTMKKFITWNNMIPINLHNMPKQINICMIERQSTFEHKILVSPSEHIHVF